MALKLSSIIHICFVLLVSYDALGSNLFIDDPIPLLQNSNSSVEKVYPGAKLILVATFLSLEPVKGCSSIGWEFVYFHGKDRVITIKNRFHHMGNNLECRYVKNNKLIVENKDFDGFFSIHDKTEGIKVNYGEALTLASDRVGSKFIPYGVQISTPVHPKTMGKVFYFFRGNLSCNKEARVWINAKTGKVLEGFTQIPDCN